MRALIQRVSEARVVVDTRTVGKIGPGLLIFLGIKHTDTVEHARKLVNKILGLRVFSDAQKKMNFNVSNVNGALLVVSQFTLYGDTRQGNRPSYSQAAVASQAEPIYRHFVELCRESNLEVETGVFQSDMKVHLVNDGPVTILCESES